VAKRLSYIENARCIKVTYNITLRKIESILKERQEFLNKYNVTYIEEVRK